ncbi:MAG: serine--tRNA ligase [Rhodospirillaceae bacterium]|jgi:seryl-tRNA synthetase|nr:serine--tRNA ligase [Rhodospirillaceae bacterium]
MFDIKWIRENAEAFDQALTRRPGQQAMAEELIALDGKRREAQTRAQDIQTERNALSKEIGAAKSRGEDAAGIIAQVSESKQAQAAAEQDAANATAELNDVLAGLPNLPLDEVPDGNGEDDNVEVKKWGEPKTFDFEPKDHVDLGEGLGMMDFETAAKISGARFVMLTGPLARMERALANLMLNVHTRDNGYTEVNPPALVNDATMYGTGQLPKFGEDLFKTDTGHWLIPTAEVPLTNIIAGHLVEPDYLPRRYTAMTWCFRSEAGAAGKDTRGMIRQHQFTKVEMVSVTKAEDSLDELEHMTRCAEGILERLELPYRTIALCTGDMGFGARKTYDIEVWLPAQNTYREISSCSVCGDFQARRMNARYRTEKGGKQTAFVHTLNGSGLAVGRTLVAILENYQQPDGSVVIPKALRHFMGGLEVLEPTS